MTLSNDSMNQRERDKAGGLSDFVLQRLKRVIAADPTIERAYLYGSRGRGDWRRYSDIDLAIDGSRLRKEAAARLQRRHDESNIVYPLDVVALPDLAPDSLLWSEIKRDALLIYDRDNEPSPFTDR